MGKNMNRLGSVLSGRMNKTARENVPTTLELGVINNDMSLTTDGLSGRIEPRDYMVDIRLASDSCKTESATVSLSGGTHGGHESGNGSHTHTGGEHSHTLPKVYRGLKPGDRVLVAWVGNEPIVIAVLVSGDTKI